MTKKPVRVIIFGLFLMAVFAVWPIMASATSFTYDLGTEFSNGTPSTGTLTAVIDDGGTAGDVTVTMSFTGAGAGEFISEWSFNFANISTVTLNYAFDNTSTGPQALSVTDGLDCCQADGDGNFDVQFNFPTANSADRFTTGETVKYTITGTGITANDFNLTSVTGGGQGVWCTAAHVQGIGTNNALSGWMGGACDGSTSTFESPIPEPSSFLLLGSGLLGLATFVRRRFRQD